jgi:hypothetical protein
VNREYDRSIKELDDLVAQIVRDRVKRRDDDVQR